MASITKKDKVFGVTENLSNSSHSSFPPTSFLVGIPISVSKVVNMERSTATIVISSTTAITDSSKDLEGA